VASTIPYGECRGVWQQTKGCSENVSRWHIGGCVCALTFELSGRHWKDAWPARCMMTASASRAKWLAGGGPLERRVRRHFARRQHACRLEPNTMVDVIAVIGE
jgi:hypothetical protein